MRADSDREPLRVDPPRLSRRPGPATPFPDAAIADRGAYGDLHIAQGAFADAVAEDMTFDRILFKRADHARSALSLLQATDVRWDTADFTEARWERAYFVRVEWTGCRMLGVQMLEARFEHVRFVRSTLSYARLWNARCDHVRFEHCEMREASFVGADLGGVVFERCDLQGADFRDTKLKGTDFRGSQLDGIKVGIADLAGAIIDPIQAVQLASLLGVTVRREDPPM